MKRGTLVCAPGRLLGLALLFVPTLFAPSVAASPADEAELVRLQHAYARALVQKDREFLLRYYAPDWRGGNWTGFWTRSRMLSYVLDKRYVVKSMTVRDVEVRIMGSVAVVQGWDDEVTSMEGRDTSGRWGFTDVFEKRDGRWVAVASHTSEIRPRPR